MQALIACVEHDAADEVLGADPVAHRGEVPTELLTSVLGVELLNDDGLSVTNSVRSVWHADLMVDKAVQTSGLELIPIPAIQRRIIVVRERNVMLDEDLAELYGVETRRLVEQVKRNRERFPSDFMFQLTKDEAAALRSQIAISNVGRGGRRYAHMCLPSKALRCSPVSCAAREPSRST